MANTQDTSGTLNINLVNRSNTANAWAYITGRALNRNNALVIIAADGRSQYYPSSPSGTVQPLEQDVAIPLGAPGATKQVVVPKMAGARIYFSYEQKLQFFRNPGPALVEPSVANPSDPSINIHWGFCEFTYNDAQVYVNISYVDFVGLPIALTLQSQNSPLQRVTGIPANGLDTICAQLQQQDSTDHAGWSQLVVTDPSGANIRALSPNLGIVRHNALFSGYYASYVDQVWQRYTTQPLRINTQASFGALDGKVSGSTLSVGAQRFSQPSAADIFSCSTGPFAENGIPERAAIIPRLAAAFNRSTLLATDNIPDGSSVGQYYQTSPTNHYSRILHAVNADRRGYAFPYDDVAPDGGVDQSGSVFSGDPVLLTVEVGGEGVSASAEGVSVAEEKGEL